MLQLQNCSKLHRLYPGSVCPVHHQPKTQRLIAPLRRRSLLPLRHESGGAAVHRPRVAEQLKRALEQPEQGVGFRPCLYSSPAIRRS